jgi:3-(3-hydroxy-phenyl)propionate hydroxylase
MPSYEGGAGRLESQVTERFQVIIAGAGPVGTVAAYRLALAGIKVLVLEAAPTCTEDLRASTFHAPTLDMMEELGVLDELERLGLKAPVYQYRNRRTDEILRFDLGEIADRARHPYRLQCEQFKLSRHLVKLMQDIDPDMVRFSRRTVHVQQNDKTVRVHVETPVAIEAYDCDYLIAADGANSIIRKWLGVSFDGFTYPEKFLTLSTEWPLEDHFSDLAYVNYMADRQEWCVLLRVPSMWRVLVPAQESDPDDWLLSDEKKEMVFGGLVGDGRAVRTMHRTVYRVHQRVATAFRHGRILLAGDAAHLNNPLGGLGMNSGIHDVWNLTEKLRDILLDGANPDALLDRYDRQRRTVMNEFVQAQTKSNKETLEQGDIGAQSRQQGRMVELLADDERRRDFLLTQSMFKSLEREAAII